MISRRELSRRATHERVLAEAHRIFVERGFDATTIREVAESSGVSVGTVMAVGDKPSLLVRVFDGLIQSEQDGAFSRAKQRPAGRTTASSAEQLLGLVTPFVTLFVSQQALARTYASILATGNHSSSLFTELAGPLVEEMRVVIERSGCANADSSPALARTAYAAYVGILFTWSARASDDQQGLTDSLREAFAVICGASRGLS